MLKKYRIIMGVAVIVVFGGLALWSLIKTATPYVGFRQARTMQKIVQVLGKVEHETASYDDKTGIFSFYIVDESGDRMKVNYPGIKPANFEQAESVVCVGRYNDGVFVANLLLVKCPSKYQGVGMQDKGV